MSKQEIRIVAIPTKKATTIELDTLSNTWGIFMGYFDEYDKKGYQTEDAPNGHKQFHHLYGTTDETPKADEYGYSISTNTVELISELQSRVLRAENWRKVVATDDKSLLKNDCDCGATTYEGCSQCLTGIGKLSPEFQAAWVREANKSTPIVNAMMEMEDIYHSIVISGGLRPLGEIGGKGLTHSSSIEYKPKLNPQGYVTILPVKEKMYNIAFIENLLIKFATDCDSNEDLIMYDGEIDGVRQYNSAKEWLKENL